jgi:hypothetical protein
MIRRDYWRLSHPNASCAASYGTRAMCEEWRDRNPLGRDPTSYVIERVPCCDCCGDDFACVRDRGGSISHFSNGQVRCDRHIDRNPCAIEGCARTTAAPKSGAVGDDQWLCAEHWRRLVPPRSRLRRAYLAFFRRAKRQGGWDEDLKRRFWRFWDAVVRTARRRATQGRLDEAEINRMFGWG